MTSKIAEAECPNCHAVLDVTETEGSEPSRVRRFLRRVARFLQLVSEIGQHVPSPKRPATYNGPTCSVFVLDGGSFRHILSEGPPPPRRMCGKPAPNWKRLDVSRSLGVPMGNTAICDDCALKLWGRNHDGLVRTSNGVSKTKNVGAST